MCDIIFIIRLISVSKEQSVFLTLYWLFRVIYIETNMPTNYTFELLKMTQNICLYWIRHLSQNDLDNSILNFTCNMRLYDPAL